MPRLEAEPGAPYPVIRAELSELTQLQRAGTELMEQGKSAAAELQRDPGGGAGPDRGGRAGGDRGTSSRTQGRTAARLSEAAGTLNTSSERLGPLLDDLSAGLAHVCRGWRSMRTRPSQHRGGGAAVDRTARRLSDLTIEAAPGLTTLTRDGMPELVAVLKDLRTLTGRLDRLAADLEQQPNLLLYDRPRRPGPGERALMAASNPMGRVAAVVLMSALLGGCAGVLPGPAQAPPTTYLLAPDLRFRRSRVAPPRGDRGRPSSSPAPRTARVTPRAAWPT